MPGNLRTLSIQISADTKAAQTQIDQFTKSFQASINSLSSVSGGIGQGLLGGLGVGLGAGGVGIGLTIGQQIIEGIKQAIGGGINFDTLLQSSQIGIAASMRAFQPDTFKTFNDAMKASGDVIDMLQQKEKTLPTTMADLLRSFQATTAAATQAGVSYAQQVDILSKVTVATHAMGMEQQRIPTFLSEIYAGNIRVTDPLARNLGITKEAITAAREHGQMYDYLSGKLAAFAEAVTASAGTLPVLQTTAESALQRLEGDFAKPIIKPLSDALIALTGYMNSGEAHTAFNSWGGYLAVLASEIVKVAEAANSARLAILGMIQTPFNNKGLSQQDLDLADNRLKSQGFASDADRAKAYAQNAALHQTFTQQKGANEAQNLGYGVTPGGTANLDLYNQPSVVNPPEKEKKGGGGGDPERKAALADLGTQQQTVTNLEKQYSDALKITDLEEKAGLITGQQKRDMSIQALSQEKTGLQQLLAQYEAEFAPQSKALDPKQVEVFTGKIQQLKDKIQEIALIQQSQTFSGSFWAAINNHIDSLGTTGASAAGEINKAFDSTFNTLGSGLAGVIEGTKSFGQVWQQVGNQIIEQLIKILAQKVEGDIEAKILDQGQIGRDASKAASGAWSSAAGIPYIGWLLAPAAAVAAFAGVEAYENFDVGGWTGSGGKYEPAGIVHKGEYVFDQSSVSRIGLSTLSTMHKGYSGGGLVGGGSGGGGVHVSAFIDKKAMLQHLKSQDGQKIIFDVVAGKTHLLPS